MKTYDVYIKTQAAHGNPNGETIIRRSSSWNPDDAIAKLQTAGDYLPSRGDVVTRCVEVDYGQETKGGA
jgi:hypothetical protein